MNYCFDLIITTSLPITNFNPHKINDPIMHFSHIHVVFRRRDSLKSRKSPEREDKRSSVPNVTTKRTSTVFGKYKHYTKEVNLGDDRR